MLVFVAVGSQRRGYAIEAEDAVGGGSGLTDLAESAVDGAGTDAKFLDGLLDRADLIFHFGHEDAELAKLRLGGGEDLPDFVALFLDGEHVEAHLEAGEDGGEGTGPGDGDLAFGLDLGLEGVAAYDLGVETFGGQEHDGVRRGDGWVDVFAADTVAFGSDCGLECFACGGESFGIVGLVGGFEALPVFAGELGVDGKEGFA